MPDEHDSPGPDCRCQPYVVLAGMVDGQPLVHVCHRDRIARAMDAGRQPLGPYAVVWQRAKATT